MNRPVILQVIPQLDTGGAELSTVEIAAAIVMAGGRALVATQGGRMADAIVQAGGEIISLPVATKNPLRVYANAARIARLIEANGVDLVHARSRAPAWSALWAARRMQRPFVTTYHGAYAEKGPLKRAYNRVMAEGDRVIANSAYTAGLIRARYGTPDAKVRIIHRGVDEVTFDAARLYAGAPDPGAPDPGAPDPDTPNRVTPSPAQGHSDRLAALRIAWNLSEPTPRTPAVPVILHAARLTRWKGQTVLIDALALFARAHPALPWIAILAGDDQGRSDYANELHSLAARHGIEDRVRLVGHVADMPAAFALAAVTVIASVEPEAFGRTAIEAQRMGSPVIATRIGAPPETVLATPDTAAEHRTGWLIRPGDPGAMADAIYQALTLSADARASLAIRASMHAGTKFTLDAMRAATLGVYDELLGTDLADRFKAASIASRRS